MPRDPFEHIETDRRLQDTPLVSHLAPFATSLVENGYVKSSVQSKLSLLASFGQWLKLRRLSITDFDEQLAERFIAYKRRTGRVHRGNRETLLQFLDHLRKRDAVPGPTPTRDDSPLAAILTRYERHLRSERGLAAATVINYLPCIRKFLMERFREKPLVVREVRSSDVSDFLLRHAPTMSPRRAQLVTAAFRSFFRFLFQNGELQVNLALSVGMVRRFAAWHSAKEPRTEVPAPGLLPHRYQRKTPHIYSDEEIASLLRLATQLPSAKGLRASTYTTLFGLLAVSGMRVNEALHLDKPDVDLDQGVLTIRRTKFGKSRHVPIHLSTVGRLKEYAEKRDRVLRKTPSQAFFLSERGTRITEWIARYTFAKLSQQLGFRRKAKGHGRGPRLHDMRHRFAALTLVRWYRQGLDVERELPKLATYLGHVHINETYWYLEAVPELLQLATDRLVDNGKEARR